MTDLADPPVLVEQRGRLGLLTLNRPRSINALDLQMVHMVTEALHAWADDPTIATVAITGAGERGLCAGGDIVVLYRAAKGEDPEQAAEFWRAEYMLNSLISRYPKPYVALMDGIVLGGGVGISAHGSHRIVTERTRIGMPETGIGYVPDVGGTRLLALAPGELGTHAALTGGMLGAGDAVLLGLADSYVPSDRLEDLLVALETRAADDAIAAEAESAPAAMLAGESWIDDAYAGDDLQSIVDRLSAGAESARAVAEVLARRSPTALAITLRALRIAAGEKSLEAALQREYRVSMHMLDVPDFAEGIRAQVIDKDRTPHWMPTAIVDVDAETVERAFGPVDPELQFPAR